MAIDCATPGFNLYSVPAHPATVHSVQGSHSDAQSRARRMDIPFLLGLTGT
jgi:hypothetical protein